MSDQEQSQEQPQLYLITPSEIDLETFPKVLGSVLDAHDIACVRLALATTDEDALSRAADALRETCIARDVAIVIEDHIVLAERLGLDGVHLSDGAKTVRYARKTLGADAIVGSHCGASRHDGISAGEAGADYISFGPVGETNLGDGTQVETELFQWWSEMIEVPCVAEGALSVEHMADLATQTDFYGIREIWAFDDPAAALSDMLAKLSQ
ncbi:MAG: thiamine phosphate synthase [Aliishimia sp.]